MAVPFPEKAPIVSGSLAVRQTSDELRKLRGANINESSRPSPDVPSIHAGTFAVSPCTVNATTSSSAIVSPGATVRFFHVVVKLARQLYGNGQKLHWEPGPSGSSSIVVLSDGPNTRRFAKTLPSKTAVELAVLVSVPLDLMPPE